MPSPIKNKEEKSNYRFSEILPLLMDGKKFTRIDWGNTREFILMNGGFLSIHHADGGEYEFHRLIVSDGDITANDWVVC